MKIISHRGNLEGSCEDENSPLQICKALDCGFECEIDLWFVKNKLMLGHDEPQYRIDKAFLQKPGLWIHAKNIDALNWLHRTTLNYFWHEQDKATITSKGYIWCCPDIYCVSGITVTLNYIKLPEKICGICTDFPNKYKKIYDIESIN